MTGFNKKAPKDPVQDKRYNSKEEKAKASRFSKMDGLYDSGANAPLDLLDGIYVCAYI